MLTFVVILFSIFVAICFYLIARLIAVDNYSTDLVRRAGAQYDKYLNQCTSTDEVLYYYSLWESIIVKGPLTRELVFSFKSLKDEYWFNEIQIKFLNGDLKNP